MNYHRTEKSPVFRVQISSEKLNHNVKAGFNGQRKPQPEPVQVVQPTIKYIRDEDEIQRLEHELYELRAAVKENSNDIAINSGRIAKLDSLKDQVVFKSALKELVNWEMDNLRHQIVSRDQIEGLIEKKYSQLNQGDEASIVAMN